MSQIIRTTIFENTSDNLSQPPLELMAGVPSFNLMTFISWYYGVGQSVVAQALHYEQCGRCDLDLQSSVGDDVLQSERLDTCRDN